MTYSGKNVLVTGADGFIGSHLAEQLTNAGAKTTALVQYNPFDSHGWIEDLPADIRAAMNVVRGDVRDPAFIARLVRGQDIVFHLAALIAIPYSYEAAQSYVDVNVTGTLNVLEAARNADVGRVVHTSTSEVYGTAITTPIAEDHPLQGQSPYSASKIGADMMVEAYARSFDLPAVILRPFNTYGPRQSERAVIPTVIRQALDPECTAIKVGDLSPQRDFNFVEDTARAFQAVGLADGLAYGTAYNAGSGVAHTIGDMVGKVLAITGCNKPLETEAARMRPAKSEVRVLLAGSDRIRGATEWAPQTDFDQGLETTLDWWRGRINAGKVRGDTSYAT